MTFTPDWVDLIPDDHERRSRPLDQRGGDVLVIAHHSVSRTIGSILSTFKSADRTVTANYGIGPVVAGVDDYKAVLTVRENEDRAYTTSSSKDDIAITFEMADLQLAPPWPVGNTGLEILVELIIHAHEAYGMPVDRYHVTCHREVYERGWGSYATACPGDHLHGSLDWAVDEANRRIAGGTTSTTEEDQMHYIQPGSGLLRVSDELGVDTVAQFADASMSNPEVVDAANRTFGQYTDAYSNNGRLESVGATLNERRWDLKRKQIAAEVLTAIKPLLDAIKSPEISQESLDAAVDKALDGLNVDAVDYERLETAIGKVDDEVIARLGERLKED